MAFIKMKLTKTLYQLLYNLPSAPPEIGGLIGQSRKSDTIDTAFIDEGKFVYQDICQYTPDEILLNHIIADSNGRQYCSHYDTYYYPRERQGCLSYDE